MEALDAEPRNKEWLKLCDPTQTPLKGEKGWKKMEKIFLIFRSVLLGFDSYTLEL